jgi:hypothetical protein
MERPHQGLGDSRLRIVVQRLADGDARDEEEDRHGDPREPDGDARTASRAGPAVDSRVRHWR